MDRKSQEPSMVQFSDHVGFIDQAGFAMQFVNIVIASAVIVIGVAKFQIPDAGDNDALAADLKHLFSLFIFLIGIPLAFVFAVTAATTIKFNKWVIGSFLVVTVLSSFVFLIFCFVLKKWFTGILGAFIVILVVVPFATRHRSLLVMEAFVSNTFHSIKEDPRLAIPAVIFGVITTLWSTLWACLFLMISYSSYPPAVRVLFMLIILFSWIFITLFLRSFAHLMMSGILSAWYFYGGKIPSSPSSTTFAWSFKRSIKLVGSACMASVFSAIGAICRFFFQGIPLNFLSNKYMKMANNFCLFYQNHSLAHVICYNQTFLTSDVLVRHSIQEKIFEPISDLLFVERFMTTMAFTAALIGGSVGGISAHLFGFYHVLSFIAIGGALGFTITLVCLEIFNVMSHTTFVCLAQEPGSIAPIRIPELIEKLKEIFPSIRTL